MGPGVRRDDAKVYALVPVNGKLPIGPMPISPEMLSPATLPVKASVSGIGLVIETFQATSSPLAVPSKISVELPSAPCVPVSLPPEFCRLSVALRSPIGVLMVIFQFPSTAIAWSPHVFFRKTGMVLGSGWAAGGIAHLAADAQSSRLGAISLFDAFSSREPVPTSLENAFQARAAARIRLVTRMRNATYCT